MPDPVQVRSMFGRIARRYDFLNRLLSMGIDRGWRRTMLRTAGQMEGARVVDVCCGTGDVAFTFQAAGADVVGIDFTPEMLLLAAAKDAARSGRFVRGDALALPVRTACADAVTIAFGIRNVADRAQGLAELARVARPGGRVLVLEFTLPPGRISGALYRLYFTRILPFVGGFVSGDRAAYRYLPDTVLAWPDPRTFQREMEAVGLVDCGFRLLTGGIACLSFGTVPRATTPST